MWLDRDQSERLRGGQYFATVVRSEKACWIRSLDDESVAFFMNNAPSARRADDGMSRVSLFGATAYTCAKSDAQAPVPSKASCDASARNIPAIGGISQRTSRCSLARSAVRIGGSGSANQRRTADL